MKKSTIKQFYIETLYEILIGTDLKNIDSVLKDFEDEELYEECAGIKKALDLAEKKTIEEIELEYLELIGKYHER
jgi:hypothetical protein